MKTTNNISRIARQGLAISTFLFAAAFVPVHAADPHSNLVTISSIAEKSLEQLTREMEDGIRFKPAETDIESEAREMELNMTLEELDQMNGEMEKDVNFRAPEVNVKAEAAEAEYNEAMESLDKSTNAFEQSVMYHAPAAE